VHLGSGRDIDNAEAARIHAHSQKGTDCSKETDFGNVPAAGEYSIKASPRGFYPSYSSDIALRVDRLRVWTTRAPEFGCIEDSIASKPVLAGRLIPTPGLPGPAWAKLTGVDNPVRPED